MIMLYKRLRSFALHDPVRSSKWLSHIRRLPCCECGTHPPSEPHHLLGSVHGLKSSDIFTVPLCRPCHDKHEREPKRNPELIECAVKVMHEYLRGLL